MAQENISAQLNDLLASRDFQAELLDKEGRPTDAENADIFTFDFVSSSGKNYGTMVIILDTDNEMQVFYGDNLGRSMEGDDKTEFFDFVQHLHKFANMRRWTYSPKNINQVKYTMQGLAAIREGLFEGYYGTRRVSYSGEPTEARLVIQHNRVLGETDARFRYVESLFIETADAERFRLQFKNLAGGRAMLEHVRQGGRPYDIRGSHITEMVSEIATLSRFNRASAGRVLEGVTAELVTEAQQYYRSMRENLKRMAGTRGYQAYFESWHPAETTLQEELVENIKTMFVQQTLDSRIEAALPVLARLQQENRMKEADIFESWADNLTEGTWQLPETPEQQQKLQELMSGELIVGPDAANATQQLNDLVGDDVLFDRLGELAARDASANVWDDSEVQARLAELGIQLPAAAEPAADNNDDGDDNNDPAAQQPMNEGRVKELEMDIVDPLMSDSEFETKYEDSRENMARELGMTQDRRTGRFYNPDQQQGVAEGSLREFAMGGDGDGGDDSLFNYAKFWYNGDLKIQKQVERALQKSGLDIGENEDENGGAYISDKSGDYYESWTAEDLKQGVAEGQITVESDLSADDAMAEIFRIRTRPGLTNYDQFTPADVKRVRELSKITGLSDEVNQSGKYYESVRDFIKRMTNALKPEPAASTAPGIKSPADGKEYPPGEVERVLKRLQKISGFKRLHPDPDDQMLLASYVADQMRGGSTFDRAVQMGTMEYKRKEQGVTEGSSTAMAHAAKRLTDPKDGATAKLRAAGDRRREDDLKSRNIAKKNEGVAEVSLNELAELTRNYYTLSNGKTVQVIYRPNVNQSPIPLTGVKVSYVNPALQPQGGSFDSTGQAQRWDSAPDGVKQAIEKFVKQPGMTETALRDKADLVAKRRALQDLSRNPGVDQRAVQQRQQDLEKEARSRDLAECDMHESQVQESQTTDTLLARLKSLAHRR